MKRTFVLISGLFLLTGLAVASSHGDLMTADHPLYSAKMAGEEAVEGMAPNETEEAKAKVKHAEKRANESAQLAEEGKDELANETANAYAQEMQEVNDLGSQISDLAQQQKINELVAKATQHHADVLSTVYDRLPEQARQGVEKALNMSVEGHRQAVQNMQDRGQPTDGMNMSEHIPSDVQGQVGIDLSGLGGGPPSGVGGQQNGSMGGQ